MNMIQYRTLKQRHVANLLASATGVRLEDWLAARRREGLSYESMAYELRRLTGESVTLRTATKWYAELVDDDAA
jgi:hypothetical protein